MQTKANERINEKESLKNKTIKILQRVLLERRQ